MKVKKYLKTNQLLAVGNWYEKRKIDTEKWVVSVKWKIGFILFVNVVNPRINGVTELPNKI